MTVNEEEMIGFHVANKAAMHLGRKLYSTTPPALAELIANSYDAYATEVYVELGSGETIVVADNGIGMDFGGLKDRYAIVGNTKIPDEAPEGIDTRKPMGKKGIGKLASFSLGEEYEVYTRTEENNKWRNFVVNYHEYISKSNQSIYNVPSRLVDLPDELQDYAGFKSGFIVVIREPRRRVTPQTITGIQNQLSRRFYIRSQSDNFVLYLNGEPVDLSRNVYYGSLEYVSFLGFDKDKIRDMLSPDGDCEIDFEEYAWQRTQTNEMRDTFENLVKELHVMGWIGTVSQPKQLKGDAKRGEASNSNIVVYINRKIADEDVLKGDPNAMIASEYVVGEFFADYLGEGEEDPITSSRQGLDYDDPNVVKLVSAISRMRSHVLEEWGKRRERDAVKKMPSWLQDSEPYKKWESDLSPSQKKLNSKLLKVVSVQLDHGEIDDERACSMVNGIIDVVTNADVYRLADEIGAAEGADQEMQLASVAELLSRIAASERLKQAQIVSERLAAIDRLEDLMSDPANLEKTFEDHLFDNPWLINPYWNQSTKAQGQLKAVRQKFHKLYDDMEEEYRNTFIDIYIEVAEEKYPIIIELKRNNASGYAKATPTSIQEQIGKYRKAIIQELGLDAPDAKRPSVIKAYFILSQDTGKTGQGHKITFDDDDLETFRVRNIEILPYNKLVSRARQAYQEHMRVLDETESLPFLRLNSDDEPSDS